MDSETILQMILPYLINMFEDDSMNVKAKAMTLVIDLLKGLNEDMVLPPYDFKVNSNYN